MTCRNKSNKKGKKSMKLKEMYQKLRKAEKMKYEMQETEFILDGDSPKFQKKAGNLSLLEKIADRWYRFLERIFAPGCYYIGKDVASKLPRPDLNLGKIPSRLVVNSEAASASFGVNVVLMLLPGMIFGNAVVIVPFRRWRLCFFRPISMEGSPVKIALGRRSFVEGDTIVLDGTIPASNTGEYAYALNVPNYIAKTLRSLTFWFGTTAKYQPCGVRRILATDGAKSAIAASSEHIFEYVNCRLSSSCSRGESVVSCVLSDKGDGTAELKVMCASRIVKVLPDVIKDDYDGNLPVKIGCAKRFCSGYIISRGDKTEVLEQEVRMPKKDSEESQYVPTPPGVEIGVRLEELGPSMKLEYGEADAVEQKAGEGLVQTQRTIVLAEGLAVLQLPLDKGRSVATALKAFSENVSSIPLPQAELMDELFTGENALYLRWHRGWSNQV